MLICGIAILISIIVFVVAYMLSSELSQRNPYHMEKPIGAAHEEDRSRTGNSPHKRSG